MGDVVPLSHIAFTLEAMHGYADYGGKRYGMLLIMAEERVRVWLIENGKAVHSEIPDTVLNWARERGKMIFDAMRGTRL